MTFGPLRIRTVDQPHGPITSAGFRFDYNYQSAAYSTDFNKLPHEAMLLFQRVDLWVVDALRRRPHPTHPHLAQTLEWIRRVEPRQAVLTHMDQSMDYDTLLGEQIGRAHVCTPVTNAHLVCRLMLEKKKNIITTG